MQPTQTAVIVVVDEAEPVVGRFRAWFDRSAGWGVPPHVTVLYPFLPPERVDDTVLAALREICAGVPAFETTLARVAWFGETVLFLAPEPDRPFRALTRAVWDRFPGYPRYGGTHADPVPHLTVGHDAPVDLLRAAADAVTPHLPIRVPVTTVRLIEGSAAPGSWRTVADLPLGPR